jgi:hypothetical protein
MFTSVKAFFLLSVTLVVLSACQSDLERIVIADSVFNVTYAVTPQEQEKGLMFVDYMPDNQGMVFLYQYEAPRKFWMKNTLIPLDMLFFDKDMRLVHIEENATPHDLSPRGPDQPTCVVVELNGGQASANNIKIGDILSLNRPYKCLH